MGEEAVAARSGDKDDGRSERLRRVVEEVYGKKQASSLARFAETLEGVPRSAEPVADVSGRVGTSYAPESPAMGRLHEALRPNGYPKVEVRVSLQEKEAWMRHAYGRGMNLSEFIRETMNEIVASGGD